MSKKILVISMIAGSGHLRAARALVEYGAAHSSKFKVEHLDVTGIASPVTRLFNKRLYELSVQNFPEVWGRVYKTFDKPRAAKALRRASRLQEPFNGKLAAAIKEKDPNGIIFTYVGAAQMLAPVCRKKIPKIKMGIVVTDYHGHSFYNIPDLDWYFVADRFVLNGLARAGVAPEKIFVTGIPVDPRFYAAQDVNALKTKYGFRPDARVALLFAGCLPKDAVTPTITRLLAFKPAVSLVVMTSGNKELYEELSATIEAEQKRYALVNWTETMDEYMRVADAVISKPGGMTVSECTSLQKPMIIVNPIPGQEYYNARFMVRHRLGIAANDPISICNALEEILKQKRKGNTNVPRKTNPSKLILNQFLDENK